MPDIFNSNKIKTGVLRSGFFVARYKLCIAETHFPDN